MNQQNIADWKIKRVSNGEVYDQMTSGTVLGALRENGVIPDPFVGDNEKYALEMMEEDFEYEAVFDCDDNVFSGKKKELVFEGIDTIADVFLNGQKLFHAENMHRTYVADVSGVIREKGNTLKVYLYSPLKFIRDAYKECRCDGAEDAMEGFAHIRKAHCMFGWDWGPRIPDAGIFRPVYIRSFDRARIDNIRIHQRHFDEGVGLKIFVDEVVSEPGEETSMDVKITSPLGKEIIISDYKNCDEIQISNPLLWWPNGYGEQNLYTVEVVQKAAGEVIDAVTKRIGLRTMTLTRKKDEWGESFSHCVNGVDVFAMGADYIPEDNFLADITPERTRRLLEDCKISNFNTIRVWGGGFFPGDECYDMCD